MGNRAIVKPKNKDIGVYLHWNGGVDSVTAFLKYCELKEFRSFDDPYGMARFCQVVGNFFGGGLSIGIETNIENTEEDAMYLDNGIYIVEGWDIIDHIGEYKYPEGYDLDDMLKEIDIKQPKNEQLGEFLDAIETDISDIKVGDLVFINVNDGHFSKLPVIGIGEDKVINGRNVSGAPYVHKWGNGSDNINNYIFDKVRVLRGDQ